MYTTVTSTSVPLGSATNSGLTIKVVVRAGELFTVKVPVAAPPATDQVTFWEVPSILPVTSSTIPAMPVTQVAAEGSAVISTSGESTTERVVETPTGTNIQLVVVLVTLVTVSVAPLSPSTRAGVIKLASPLPLGDTLAIRPVVAPILYSIS